MKNLLPVKLLLIHIAKLTAVIVIMTSCDFKKTASLTLVFKPYVNIEPLELGTKRYPNPNGSGEFTVENFKFYLTNINLLDSTGHLIYKEPDSYHLVHFNDGQFILTFDNVPKEFHQLQLSIGVDSLANSSINSLGDLNPNSSMAWSWSAGYKFLVMEGNYHKVGNDRILPLVYHIGFPENYQTIVFSKDLTSTNEEDLSSMHFRVDVAALFQGNENVNFDSIPSVTFNRKRANQIAHNFANMISLD